ncbi:hypothetical protein ASE91_14020 [Sphingomonas sp. Leaf62]|nr:hypothetical protein ASE91_14020 [Sphingomonas sp. Leaf62]
MAGLVDICGMEGGRELQPAVSSLIELEGSVVVVALLRYHRISTDGVSIRLTGLWTADHV